MMRSSPGSEGLGLGEWFSLFMPKPQLCFSAQAARSTRNSTHAVKHRQPSGARQVCTHVCLRALPCPALCPPSTVYAQASTLMFRSGNLRVLPVWTVFQEWLLPWPPLTPFRFFQTFSHDSTRPLSHPLDTCVCLLPIFSFLPHTPPLPLPMCRTSLSRLPSFLLFRSFLCLHDSSLLSPLLPPELLGPFQTPY